MSVITMRPNQDYKKGPVDLINTYFSDSSSITMIEIGSYAGESTQLFLSTGKVKKIYCIDPWMNYNSSDPAARTNNEAQKVFDRKFISDSRVIKIKAFSYNAIKDLTQKVDLLYVDGDHSYTSVFNDLCMFADMVKDTGVIAGHDYQRIRFISVINAVNSFLRIQPQHLFSDTSWAIKKSLIPKRKDKCMIGLISKDYLKQYNIMLQSFKKYNPDYDLLLFCDAQLNIPDVNVIDISEELNAFPKDYTMKHKIWSYRAKATLRALSLYQTVVYCDSDLYFYNSIPEFNTTTFTQHYNHGYKGDRLYFLARDGWINTGFYVAKREQKAIDWFNLMDAVYKQGKIPPLNCGGAQNDIWDQKFYLYIKWFWPDVSITHHDGLNIAGWNLYQRNVHYKDNILMCNEDPVVFIHYSKANGRRWTKFGDTIMKLRDDYLYTLQS